MADPSKDTDLNQPNRAAESRETADSKTADSKTADSKTADKTANSQTSDSETDPVAASVALLPEPFTVNAEAVGLAAAAARAALRRTTGVFGRFARPAHAPPPLDAFRAATEPLKVP